jgi:enamine deaminase RidA (YjgF/YER057c/UK114 family)
MSSKRDNNLLSSGTSSTRTDSSSGGGGGGGSRTSSSAACVDNILNEFSTSLSRFKATHLFDFYDRSKTKSSSIGGNGHWYNFCNYNSTSSDGISAWQSSLDFLKAINLSRTFTSPSSTTRTDSGIDPSSSSSSSSKLDLYGRLGSLSSQLLSENRIINSVTNQLEEFFAAQFKVTTTGVFFGAVLGAAIATGVILGMMATAGAVSAASSEYVPWIFYRNTSSSTDTKHNNPDTSKSETTTSTSTPSSTSSVGNGSSLVLIQGNPLQEIGNTMNAVEQCEACLADVNNSLKAQGMTWKDNVRRVTAYLVSGECNGPTFRQALQKYDSAALNSNDKDAPSTAIVSILFVQQLEREDALVQVEVIASM